MHWMAVLHVVFWAHKHTTMNSGTITVTIYIPFICQFTAFSRMIDKLIINHSQLSTTVLNPQIIQTTVNFCEQKIRTFDHHQPSINDQ